MTIVRKKRNEDGTFSEMESVFGGETAEQTVARLEAENAQLRADSLMTLEAIAEIYGILGGGA